MRHAFLALLSSAAIGGVLAATPAGAQVAGNPGDMHTPTPYTKDYMRRTHAYPGYGYGYGNYGYGGPMAPVGALAAGVGAVGMALADTAGMAVGAPFGAGPYMGAPYAAMSRPGCGLIKDFNGRYTSVCGP